MTAPGDFKVKKEETMAVQNEVLNEKDEDLLAQKILGAIKGIRYGTVQITVHNSRVTQIDKIERIRLVKDEAV
jgi:hypothetical protein